MARLIAAGILALTALFPATGRAWSPMSLFAPCAGDCRVAIFGGNYVENSMGEVLVTSPEPPFSWEYIGGDHFIGTSISRRTATLWNHVDVEPEIGMGQRFGRQDETEVWVALYGRYHGFPWDDYVVTSVALSTGLNWASDVSDVEQERAKDGEGSQVMHYFAPEITFALPSDPNIQLLFRFHHRSGVFGLVSDAFGGAQYGTVGFRIRF